MAKKRKAIIPDPRNDENLAVAQTHLAMIRFHNRVVDTLPASVPVAQRFDKARELVTKHYQWMLRTDYLPRICATGVVNNVFTNGRKAFEVGVPPTDVPTMPIEFSVAAFRLGHSMIRRAYNWNQIFDDGFGSLDLLFVFSGLSGDLGGSSAFQAPGSQTSAGSTTSRSRASPISSYPKRKFNRAMRIDTRLVTSAQEASGLPHRREQPRVSQSHPGEDGAAGDRAADGHVPEEQGRDADEAHEGADPGRQQRRRPRAASRKRSGRRSSRTRRCGSTSSARPSSTQAS